MNDLSRRRWMPAPIGAAEPPIVRKRGRPACLLALREREENVTEPGLHHRQEEQMWCVINTDAAAVWLEASVRPRGLLGGNHGELRGDRPFHLVV